MMLEHSMKIQMGTIPETEFSQCILSNACLAVSGLLHIYFNNLGIQSDLGRYLIWNIFWYWLWCKNLHLGLQINKYKRIFCSCWFAPIWHIRKFRCNASHLAKCWELGSTNRQLVCVHSSSKWKKYGQSLVQNETRRFICQRRPNHNKTKTLFQSKQWICLSDIIKGVQNFWETATHWKITRVCVKYAFVKSKHQNVRYFNERIHQTRVWGVTWKFRGKMEKAMLVLLWKERWI